MATIDTLQPNIKKGLTILLAGFSLSVTAVLAMGPLTQDPEYHNFADQRSLAGIPNFADVVSNLAFFIAGVVGLYKISPKTNKKIYYSIFGSLVLVAFGSGYYHLAPSDQTLFWDRLPMTFFFMSLFSAVIGEYISLSLGRALFVPLLLAGAASVLFWHFHENHDLRPYILAQFFPMLAVPALLLFLNSEHSRKRGYWMLLLMYVLAKVCETFDLEVYAFSGFVSGHTLKHLLSGLGLYLLLGSYRA